MTRALLGLLAVFVGLTCAIRPCQSASWIWRPDWKVGDYWIVRSPLVRKVIDPMTPRTPKEYRDGFYFTRFLVKSEQCFDSGRQVVIEIKYRENDDFTFDEMLDSAEILVDMQTLRVSQVRVLGMLPDGSPMNILKKIARDRREVFAWTYGPHGVPDTLCFILPTFERVQPSQPNAVRAFMLQDAK